MKKQIPLADFTIGDGNLVFILGPCVLESEELALEVAEKVDAICKKRQVHWIFKSSFDKANRSSIHSFRGPGLDKGLEILSKIQSTYNIPVTTDIHLPEQAAPAAEVCDLLQIPAFLCRQTDLLVAAAETGKIVNIKKGQFLAPQDMIHPIEKVRAYGNENIILTERGTTFGYHNLVSDFRSIPIMGAFGYPICYDGAHSIQLPGAGKTESGGNREFIPHLVKASVAVGVDMIYVETHPRPAEGKSDSATMLPLGELDLLIEECLKIRTALRTCTKVGYSKF